MLGEIGGRRKGGWQRMRWLDGITNSMFVVLGELWEAWHTAIHGVAKRLTWLSDWTELNWQTELYPLNSCVEVITLRVTILGDRIFKEAIKVKWGDKGGALIQWDWCPYKKRKTRKKYTFPEKRLSEDTVGRQLSASQGRRSHQRGILDLPASRAVEK